MLRNVDSILEQIYEKQISLNFYHDNLIYLILYKNAYYNKSSTKTQNYLIHVVESSYTLDMHFLEIKSLYNKNPNMFALYIFV